MLNAIIDEKIDALHLLAALPSPPNRLSFNSEETLLCDTLHTRDVLHTLHFFITAVTFI